MPKTTNTMQTPTPQIAEMSDAKPLAQSFGSAKDIAASLESKMGCNCDLDNWQPEKSTGHSWVCRIHKAATTKWDDIQRGRYSQHVKDEPSKNQCPTCGQPKTKLCPRCAREITDSNMRCYCGHFHFQMGGSTTPTVPNNERLVILEERNNPTAQIGWFSERSGWWMVLSDESLEGEKMPRGKWCSLTIGNIIGWREISGNENSVKNQPQG